MYSTHNEGKRVAPERLVKTLKNKIYKYMSSISKNVYTYKYSNTHHKTIKIKPVDVNSSMYIEFNKENKKERPKFKSGNHVRKSKHFCKRPCSELV